MPKALQVTTTDPQRAARRVRGKGWISTGPRPPGVPSCALRWRAAEPLNLDPAALAVVAAMREAWKRFAKAETAEVARLAMEEAQALVPAYDEACRIIGIGIG